MIALCYAYCANAQNCSPNIDFETGTFQNWTCYIGNVVTNSSKENVITLRRIQPLSGRHFMASAYPSNGIDDYGGFPVNCPNGSGHSVKLGNDLAGAEAEGLSYSFYIPAGVNKYTLTYYYALVLEDPDHLPSEKPRMEISIMNITDNEKIECPSLTYFPNGDIPGFKLSPRSTAEKIIWYKEWTTVTVNLDDMAGKLIQVFVKTADCVWEGHFGYGYIDFDSECDGILPGALYCPDDTKLDLVAPYGYMNYEWYANNFTQVLGAEQKITLAPPLPAGTEVAVIVTPYPGYGCRDTLYSILRNDRIIVADAGKNTVSCNRIPVPIGTLPKRGVIYKWDPPDGLTDPNISNPYANPATTTTYTLYTSSTGGGCHDQDQVTVVASTLDNNIVLTGKEIFCMNSGDQALLSVTPADNIQWYKDNVAIPGAILPQYNVIETGTYHAALSSIEGCSMITNAIAITINSIPQAAFNVPVAAQCLAGNKFTFNNSSTNLIGEMQYRWIFGDGTEAYTRHAENTYRKAGTYYPKLIVSSNTICADSTIDTIQVYQNPIPEFDGATICIDHPYHIVNKTVETPNSPITYLWDLGNGVSSSDRQPPALNYSTPGIYPIKLSVSSVQCPTPLIHKREYLLVEMPEKGITYDSLVAVEGLPLELQSRTFGASVSWAPATSLNSSTIVNPVFRGNKEQLYEIEITAKNGCVTVDTQLVKVIKQVSIYVPAAFTPDRNGVNDILRPVTFGIKTINYFRVFNRQGQLIYQTHSLYEGWDGRYRSDYQDSQAFVWVFEGIGTDGKIYQRKGTTILLR